VLLASLGSAALICLVDAWHDWCEIDVQILSGLLVSWPGIDSNESETASLIVPALFWGPSLHCHSLSFVRRLYQQYFQKAPSYKLWIELMWPIYRNIMKFIMVSALSRLWSSQVALAGSMVQKVCWYNISEFSVLAISHDLWHKSPGLSIHAPSLQDGVDVEALLWDNFANSLVVVAT
jgi:hypothetical protein